MTTKKTAPKRTLVLKSRGQPAEILRRMRPAFREHVRPHTRNQEGERLGGGNVLSALWHHRETRDIDAYIRLGTTESGNRILDRAAAACGAYRVEHPTFKRIEFERNQDNHVDVTFGTPTPLIGEETVILDSEPTAILSTAQILSGKLQGRGMTAPVRDLFDIAVCRKADPRALEIAVNAVPDEKLNAILTIYRNLKTEYKREIPKLTQTPEALKPIRDNPTEYAQNAILNSRYKTVEIRISKRKMEIETETHGGRRTTTYEDAHELLEGMEREGVNGFLTAQDRDPTSVLNATVDALWASTDGVVLRVEPEKLNHELVNLPRIDWKPPMPLVAPDLETIAADGQDRPGHSTDDVPVPRQGPAVDRGAGASPDKPKTQA